MKAQIGKIKIYINGIRFKIKEDSVNKEKSVYLIIGVNVEKKEILCFWIAESE
ncbi:hypothetical protein [Malacoplasma iowae]|uniref:Transposase n=1 Tax=Malacoplasma iowae 695 TaxID=1048830 RepID=A0A9J7BWR9_MALIO|nr:hypothetical protein [Malacoplasma iowae]UYS84712.1 hypothetical protein EER00_05455 [Malacoplasma iowae 695]WPL35800.1 hypothetical protein QX180_00035 [Malacoplasma iowae]